MDFIFYPKNVAVIGATPKEGKVGNSIIKNLSNFKGNVYFINPKYNNILGKKCYKSILDIEEDIDLVVIVVPNIYVPNVLEECGKKGVKGAIIISAGFSEVGNYELEEKVREIAKKFNIRVIGPNCLGIINTENKLNASFSNIFPKEGNVAIISQSGAVLNAILDITPLLNIGVSKVVSLGNKIDIQESEILKYLENDERTKVIVLYIESLKDKSFNEIAKNVSKKKPIIVLKAGKSEIGKILAKSHTGALAGEYEIYKAIFKQAGLIEAETFEELIDFIHIFSTQPIPKGNNIAIITNAGGFGVLSADAVEKYKINLSKFSDVTIKELKKILPKNTNINNPLDIIGDATPERYREVIKVLSKDKNIDAFLVILTPQKMTNPLKVAEEIVKLNIKPMVTSFIGGVSVKGAKSYLRKNGYPSYQTPENGIKALYFLNKYREIKKREEDYEFYYKVKKEFLKITEKNRELIEQYLKNPNEYNIKKLLSLYGIPTPKCYIARSREDVEKYTKNFKNSSFVMKVLSSKILHKTDIGGVIIKPENPIKAFDNLISKKDVEGVLIEEYIDGLEIFIGAKRDDLGITVLTGLGGIFVEVLKDISFGILPISKDYAIDMIKSLKGYKILEGYRGKKGDINFIAELIIKIGVIAEINNIKEIDLNPVFVFEKGGIVGDAKVIL